MALIHLDEPSTQRIPPGTFSLFALGFRPFYMLAALFAAIAIPLWLVVLSGGVTLPMPSTWWHAHEMLFGFATAVIVGFLFTAGQAWTGLRTPHGPLLAALAALWLAGRVALLFSASPWAAAIDIAFLPISAFLFVRVLVRAGSKRNYAIGGILSALGLANLMFHLAVAGVVALDPLSVLLAALALIVLLETTVAGRVVPMFTANALRGVRQWRNKSFDYATLGATALALALWVGVGGTLAALVALIAAAMQFVRSFGWNPWATRRTPILWILHVSHLWIPIGLLLIAAVEWGWVARTAAVHAFAIGSMAGLIVGMITRTALGHTGHPLTAGRFEVTAYVLIVLAAVVRVLTVVFLPTLATGSLHLVATLWTAAFVAYLIRYVPILLRSRVDGKPG